MKTMKMMTLLMILTNLTACDRTEKQFADDRESRQYRAAMADYAAGRLEDSIAGLEKVAQKEPANASARFQLACLLQDVKHDFAGAYCAFREFRNQRPDSDKLSILETRLEACEKALAIALAEKYGLTKESERAKELASLRVELSNSERRIASYDQQMETLRKRNDALLAERDRLLSVLKNSDGEMPRLPGRASMDAKKLLEEADNSDRIAHSESVAALIAEEKEETQASSSILPERQVEDLAKRDALEAENERIAAARAAAQPKHPPTYVVQEGDTLYRIAVRFYGRISAWSKIRDANKAIISNDGRVKAGETIVLP